MTIEERLQEKYGTTAIPEFASWLLNDGTLINGTRDGWQRDIDHHEIGEFFKRSKFEDLGSSYIYIKKFMRRGNIRMCCGTTDYCCEIWGTPTMEQFKTLKRVFASARQRMCRTYVDWHSKSENRYSGSWAEYLRWLYRYSNLIDTYEYESLLYQYE